MKRPRCSMGAVSSQGIDQPPLIPSLMKCHPCSRFVVLPMYPVCTKREITPIWSTDEPTDDAWTRVWYRKFYRETQAGQLMTLRPDAPALCHYPEGQQLRLAYAAGGLHAGGSATEVDSRLGPAVLRLLQEVAQELTGIRNRLIGVEFAMWLLLGAALVWFLFLRR